jgi:hypothetical protein
MFPGAVLIHCRRDLRDVAVSCWMTHFRSIRWANDPEHIATRFAQYRRIGELDADQCHSQRQQRDRWQRRGRRGGRQSTDFLCTHAKI